MPFTPFHFGPGALLHAAAPRHVSFTAFCAANVVIDFEPLIFILRDDPPLHRFFHSYAGAIPVAIATILLMLAARAFFARFTVLDRLDVRNVATRPLVIGAILGALSHIVFDSIMHADMHPLQPFAKGNALLGLISIEDLQWLCIVLGCTGALIVEWRRWSRK
ncbi:MAG: DUF4184 family protein [Betaproteobacteria bacterium]|nr:DUF4184 family protein [Betaproteobacteria bacterium]